MSLLEKNILNDLVKTNGKNGLINSSNIVNNSGKYSNVSFNSLKTKINKTPLKKEFAPANLMYFLQTAFNGNYGFLGFAFLQCYIDKDLNAQEIYDRYFKDPKEVKKIISYYTEFYDKFLDEITKERYAGPAQDLKTFIGTLKTNYKKTYFQIIPFYLLQFINEQDFKIDTAIGKKMKELVINPDFKEKCIQLYQIYNQNNSKELTEGLLPYLKNNISFQVLISNMGFNKIGKGIGDDIWIYKTGNSAGILTSNKENTNQNKINKEQLYGYFNFKTYKSFLEKQGIQENIITILLKKQVERLNKIKEKSLIDISNVRFNKDSIKLEDQSNIIYSENKNIFSYELGENKYQIKIISSLFRKKKYTLTKNNQIVLNFDNINLTKISLGATQNQPEISLNEIFIIILFILKH
jgi:hypothetical protein